MRAIFIFLILTPLFSFILAQETALIDFELQDQFDSTYNQNSFDGKVILLLGADRGGSQFTGQWGSTLADSLIAREQIAGVKFVPLATLLGVPKLMKGMIKGFFPKEKQNWTLMDWDALFAGAYNFEAEKCNIVVFDVDKNLIMHKAVTEFDELTARAILDSISLSLE